MIKKLLFVIAVIVMASCKKEESIEPARFDIEVLSGEIQIDYAHNGDRYTIIIEEGFKPVWNPDHNVTLIDVAILSEDTEYKVNGSTHNENRSFKL